MANNEPKLHFTTPDDNPPLEKVTQELWIWHENRMVKKTISYVQNLYLMVDELLVKVANNPKMRSMNVKIDTEENLIRVESNVAGVSLPKRILEDRKLSDYLTELTVEEPGEKKVYTHTHDRPTSENTISTRRRWSAISIKLNLSKFGLEFLDDDTIGLLKRRVIDLAACTRTGLKVELHGTDVPCQSFKKYVDLYLSTSMRVGHKHQNWEIWVGLADGQFDQVSFLNNSATMNGGPHVDSVTEQIITYLAKYTSKGVSKLKDRLWVFVNAHTDSHDLDLEPSKTIIEGSLVSTSLSPSFLKQVRKLGVFSANLGADKKLNIVNLEDAKLAATDKSEDCTLILIEGLSALNFVKAGLPAGSRKLYGTFPVLGKIMNVRDATPKEVHANEVIHSIKRILGLKHGRTYQNAKELRYGHLMLMMDPDEDGSHIAGLLISFLQFFWPSLLKIPDFLCIVTTPLCKACMEETTVYFYSRTEFEAWKMKLGADAARRYNIKLNKGLSSNEWEESRECFANLAHHTRYFLWSDDEDLRSIELVYSKQKIDERKAWIRLSQAVSDLMFNEGQKHIRYKDYMHYELRKYAVTNLRRCIPSIIDGLKPSQRMIVYSAFKAELVTDVKLSVLVGHVFQLTSYNHSEESLYGTIIRMARCYVGSNNINLLEPSGTYGSRATGGKDHQAVRYLLTCLSGITKYIFHEEHDVLKYLKDTEPHCLYPILPLCLVNGSNGVGSGWKTFIPCYNPQEIIFNLIELLNGRNMTVMCPWYRWFSGKIEITPTGFITTAKYEVIEDENALVITELPIQMWTETYEKFLKKALRGGKIKKYTTYSVLETLVYFKIFMAEDYKDKAVDFLLKEFELTTSFNLENMHLFDKNGLLKKYECPLEILREFRDLGLNYYAGKKMIELKVLNEDKKILENKVKFVEQMFAKPDQFCGKSKDVWLKELKSRGFYCGPEKNFEYLLSIRSWLYTQDYALKLREQLDAKETEIKKLEDTKEESIWIKDLDALKQQLKERDKKDDIIKGNLEKMRDDAVEITVLADEGSEELSSEGHASEEHSD